MKFKLLFLVLIHCSNLFALNYDLTGQTIPGLEKASILANHSQTITSSPLAATGKGIVPKLSAISETAERLGILSPPTWIPVPNLQFNMNVIGKIQIAAGVFSLNENDMLGAFVGTECRGVSSPVASLGGILFLSIGSNFSSGETITFKIYLAATDETVIANETFLFQNGGEIGSISNPFIFTYSVQCALSVSPANQNVPASPAGSTSFAVSSNCFWTAISNQTWCTVNPSGFGNGTISANYSANTTSAIRTAVITLTVAGLSPETVTVTQAIPTSATAPLTSIACVGAPAGSIVNVPVSVDSFSLITAVSLRIDYNPTLITFQNGANMNPALPGMIANNVAISPTLNKIMITWSDVNPKTLPPGSKLLDLVFAYQSGTTQLVFNNDANGGSDCEYADASGYALPDIPTANYYSNGCISPDVYQISGQYSYHNSFNTPIDSIWVMLHQGGVVADSVQTDLSGQYSFLDKTDNTYNVSNRCAKPWSGANSTDALVIQRYTSGLIMLTEPVQQQASDVNNTFFVSELDAMLVKLRFAGIETSFPRGDWTFAKPVFGGDTIVVNGADVVQDFYGLCVGDVNGSDIPATGQKQSSLLVLIPEGIVYASPGQLFNLPVLAGQAMELGAVSLVLSYPSELITVSDITMNQGSPIFTFKDGIIRLAWSELAVLHVSEGEPIITIKAMVTDSLLLGEVIRFTLENESELADSLADAFNATLKMADVGLFDPDGFPERQGVLNEIKAYPNPASKLLNLECQLAEKADVALSLQSVLGNELLKMEFPGQQAGVFKKQMDVSGFANGFYFLKINVKGRGSVNSGIVKFVIGK